MGGILEQILVELKEINEKLDQLKQPYAIINTAPAKTAASLPDLITVDVIRSYQNVGITRAYSIINDPQFTLLCEGQKKCIPKDEYIAWVESERKKRANEAKKRFNKTFRRYEHGHKQEEP
jgi:hypothetical protein